MTDQLQQRIVAALATCQGETTWAAMATAVLAELQPELDRLADYENRITWETTCEFCARILDSSIRETERRERAEAAIARVRDVCDALADGTEAGFRAALTIREALDQPTEPPDA
ncbi:hypothetical protein DV517_61950 [Streptomyces sp. S816]|uniref:hypothetical protein n=1 Tax=Streptomyces sp. S816 TaxID=2283197 RepID=UPI00109D75F3|nr:hypothetical protein [Streptomyces sp. S816]TGZ14712.1 hypothetical protein DV517_61950 [Streptomyces sp. S816]